MRVDCVHVCVMRVYLCVRLCERVCVVCVRVCVCERVCVARVRDSSGANIFSHLCVRVSLSAVARCPLFPPSLNNKRKNKQNTKFFWTDTPLPLTEL